MAMPMLLSLAIDDAVMSKAKLLGGGADVGSASGQELVSMDQSG
jgi:hypothetical protein